MASSTRGRSPTYKRRIITAPTPALSVGKVTGGSAGLVLALAYIDMLTAGDLTGHRLIAATGELGPGGSVDPVLGYDAKVTASSKAGATVFLMPRADVSVAQPYAPRNVRVIGVSSVDEAVQWLCLQRRHELRLSPLKRAERDAVHRCCVTAAHRLLSRFRSAIHRGSFKRARWACRTERRTVGDGDQDSRGERRHVGRTLGGRPSNAHTDERADTPSAFDLPPADLAYLLGRAHTLSYSDGARALVEGKRFLITGAGGSIGSEIVRQLYSLEPEAIFLLDRDESLMHAVQLNLHGHGLFDDNQTILADIRDRSAMHRIMGSVQPDVVFHVAAHKHLPPARALSDRGGQDKRARDTQRRRRRSDCRRPQAREHLDRQGGQADLRSGDDQAGRRDDRQHARVLEEPPRLGPLRQCVRQPGFPSRQPALPARARATGHDHRSRGQSLLHDDLRGSKPRDRDGGDGNTGETYVLDMGEPVRIVDLISRAW